MLSPHISSQTDLFHLVPTTESSHSHAPHRQHHIAAIFLHCLSYIMLTEKNLEALYL
jgi:hypothetical protein